MQKRTSLQYSLAIFPILYLFFIILLFINIDIYRLLLKEDNIIEYLTAIMLLATSVLSFYSLLIARKIEINYKYFYIFSIFFFALAALEEISYGQRIFDIKTPIFLQQTASQPELNLHNLFQGIVGSHLDSVHYHFFKTRIIAQQVALFYGILLPVLVVAGFGNKLRARIKIPVPPLELIPGFAFSAVLLADNPTGSEEEIGELLLSLCFFLLMWAQVPVKRREGPSTTTH